MKRRFTVVAMMIAMSMTALNLGNALGEPPRRTALDDYIAKPDDSFSWKIVRSESAGGLKTVVVDMVSQNWLTEKEVNQTAWRHWLTFSIPEQVTSGIGMLFIGGGRNNEDKPRSNQRAQTIAVATGSVVVQLDLIPNQPLIFHNDGKERVEDDLIGYTWDQFLKTGNPNWPARNPMVKAAVRAMDTITEVMASEEGGGQSVDRFVVAGGSKRGWTTWITGAVDDRVVGIIPIVIDVLNADLSMRHHFAAYGFWAPAIGNYVDHQIMHRIDHPRLEELYRLVDPYYYRHRLTMPKLVLNATGDQFFLPDSSQFYWDELRGEKYLRYVANGDHGMGDTDAVETIIAFYSLILRGARFPQFIWTSGEDGSLRVLARDTPREVRLWQANNPEARDFRKEIIGPAYSSTVIQPDGDGIYVAAAPTPDRGWTAYFLELTYDVGAPVPLKLTTEVKVTPDTLPFANKPMHLPTSVTLVCQAPDAEAAEQIAAEAKRLVQGQSFAADGLTTQVRGRRLYLNWKPVGEFASGAKLLTGYLTEKQCQGFAYQLESGPEITLPPGLAD